MFESRRRGLVPLVWTLGVGGLLPGAGWLAPLAAPAMPPGTRAPEALRDTVVSFAADILPIFQQRCAQCHGGEGEDGEVYTEAYLDLQTYKGVMAGSEYGPVVTPGDPGESVLIEMISEGEMPEEGDPVPPEEIAIISAWIEAGAPDN